MKKIFIFFWSITFPFALIYFIRQSMELKSQSITPILKQVGKLNVSIDPRIELLSAIQGISDYEMIQRNNFYYNHIEAYFTPFTHMQAVSSTGKLARIGFSYDTPVQFILHLTQPLECNRHISYPDYLIHRAHSEQYLIDYQKAIHEFALKSKFDVFWKKNESFYNEIVRLSVLEIEKIDWISAMEEYFNNSHNSYNIIISPLFSNGYGSSIPSNKSNKNDLYAFLPVNWNEENNVPHLDKNSLGSYLWHEFGHSFVNPEMEKYPEMMRQYI